MATGERSYMAVDGKWVLTLSRSDKVPPVRFIVPFLFGLVAFAIIGPLSSVIADDFRASLGNQAWAVIILAAFLSLMLVGLHWLMVKYLPDEAVMRNPDGTVAQKLRIRTLLWQVFGAIYLTVLALALYGSGVMEKAHA